MENRPLDEIRDILSRYSDRIRDERIFLFPDIPADRLQDAIHDYAHITADECPLVLIDMGRSVHGEYGALLTDRILYAREAGFFDFGPQQTDLARILSVGLDREGTLGAQSYVNGAYFLFVYHSMRASVEHFFQMLLEIRDVILPVSELADLSGTFENSHRYGANGAA